MLILASSNVLGDGDAHRRDYPSTSFGIECRVAVFPPCVWWLSPFDVEYLCCLLVMPLVVEFINVASIEDR